MWIRTTRSTAVAAVGTAAACMLHCDLDSGVHNERIAMHAIANAQVTNAKATLIAKILEQHLDNDLDDQCSTFKIDLYELVAQEIERRLNDLTIEQIIERHL